jgi:hypothetical protein
MSTWLSPVIPIQLLRQRRDRHPTAAVGNDFGLWAAFIIISPQLYPSSPIQILQSGPTTGDVSASSFHTRIDGHPFKIYWMNVKQGESPQLCLLFSITHERLQILGYTLQFTHFTTWKFCASTWRSIPNWKSPAAAKYSFSQRRECVGLGDLDLRLKEHVWAWKPILTI